MKAEAPEDLQGRLIACQHRARMVGDALQAIARSELKNPEPDTLYALGAVAEELHDELRAIESAYVASDNARGA